MKRKLKEVKEEKERMGEVIKNLESKRVMVRQEKTQEIFIFLGAEVHPETRSGDTGNQVLAASELKEREEA